MRQPSCQKGAPEAAGSLRGGLVRYLSKPAFYIRISVRLVHTFKAIGGSRRFLRPIHGGPGINRPVAIDHATGVRHANINGAGNGLPIPDAGHKV